MQRFPLTVIYQQLRLQAPIVFAVGMIIGTSTYFSLNDEPSVVAVFGGFFGSVLLGVVSLSKSQSLGLIAMVWLACGLSAGLFAGSLATARVSHVSLEKEIGPILLEGWVLSAAPAARGVRLRVKVHAIDGLSDVESPPIVRVTHISRLETEPGRFVRCWVVLRPPPPPIIKGDYAFDRQAWYSGLGAVGYVQGRCRGGALGAPGDGVGQVALHISMLRRQLAQHVNDAAGLRAGGFAAALASGDRSFMSEADQDALRRAGLAHLLAISGLHMGIVGGLAFLIAWRGLALIEPIALRLHVRKLAALVALISCAAYLVLSGASVSTQRAFIMAAIFFGAVLLDRTALSLRSLAIGMILILWIAPWSVLTPGFQMSFAATGALVATYERWNKRRRARDHIKSGQISFWITSLVVTSTVSSVATLPFALYHFERAAPLGLIANLLAMPIVSLITAPTAAIALLLAPFGWEAWPLRAFGYSLEWVLMIAAYFADSETSNRLAAPQMPLISVILLVVGIVAFCLISSARAAWGSLLGLALIAGLVWTTSGREIIHFAPSGDVFIESSRGNVERIKWRGGRGLSPLRFVDEPVSKICSDIETCMVATETVRIELVQIANGASVANLARNDGSDGAAIVTWDEIVIENGVSVEVREMGFHKINKPPCDGRAWRTCGNLD